MKKDMLGQIRKKLVRLPEGTLGSLYDLLEKLTGPNRRMWLSNLNKFLRKEPCLELLKYISSFFIKLEPGPFIVREHFVVDTSDEAKVKISKLGDNFCEWMLDLVEEQPPTEVNICCHELLEKSEDRQIITKLGGEQKVETTLYAIFALMKKQRNGERGVLLTNCDQANIFYVRNVKNVLRAVRVIWYGGGWCVSAFLVEDPYRWRAGYQVFSTNFLES
ncbi:MAG: hypothetical protein COT24_04990 [Candidatus Kerfeldbacteria bacterium CG08_land_8_20_14_0_20_40_16]|uniref:Uncharacterized protein n=1 Tax=Candidatus Kerfeldbacteria bacterium CG08_land_8_20_14_0_20_40_16 TaxID=2014244 RepID=A0A2H0YUG7_9BACT|nr:MAG: hypothetical protein COT24_04990 [Candidatus Kerfeldbacteria bacterium CG08_land_8_20_14_0_20_40_16]